MVAAGTWPYPIIDEPLVTIASNEAWYRDGGEGKFSKFEDSRVLEQRIVGCLSVTALPQHKKIECNLVTRASV
jgi:hypothetical protein